MKKILVALIAGAMMLSMLSACSDKDEKVNEEIEENQEVEETESDVTDTAQEQEEAGEETEMPADEAEEQTEEDEESFTDIALDYLGQYLDVNDYKLEWGEYKSDVVTDLDFTVKLFGNATITLPAKYSDFTSQGWNIPNYESQKDRTFDKSVAAGTQLKNSDGKAVSVNFKNVNETPAAVDGCYFYDMTLKNTTEFEISGGVTNQSSIGDVLEAFGSPAKFAISNSEYPFVTFTYEEEDGSLKFMYNYKDGEWKLGDVLYYYYYSHIS